MSLEVLRAALPRVSFVEVLLEGVVKGVYGGLIADVCRWRVLLKERCKSYKKIKQSAEKLRYLSKNFGVAGALCYCFFNLRYGLTSGLCLRAPSK